jgi:hypothetical protein
VTNLTYVALTGLRHEGKDYQAGDDISHFAPLMPSLIAAVSVGQVQLVDADGTATPPRFEVRTNPHLLGLLLDDVDDAKAQGSVASLAEAPLLPAPEPDAEDDDEAEEDEDLDFFDPADYTIPEVMEFVTEYPDQLDALIAAEAQGKARSTLLAKLDALASDE